MVTEVIMPKLGQTMEEGTIHRWVKKEGDRVQKGDILLEITTDKATLEVESYGSGVLRKILAKEGETVPVTQVIAIIAEPDEELPEIKPPAKRTEEKEKVEPKATSVAAHVEEEQTVGRIKASPLAKKLAREKSIDLSRIAGTGPGGRITKDDVLRAAEVGPAQAVEKVTEGEVIPLTPMRRAIAQAMSQSKRNIPHYYLSVNVDMTETVNRRNELLAQVEKETGARLSFNHILIRAVALALKGFKPLNSSWTETGIRVNEHINIGIAVGLEEGLIVPVLVRADEKSLVEIASQVESLVSRAKERKLKPDEYAGATFTISNLGMLGVEDFFPIINQSESAIMGVGAILEKPAVVDGKIAVRKIMKLTLSVDHRVVDGRVAAEFLVRVKEILEKKQW